MKCEFCEKPIKIMEGVYLCNECCAVSFFKNIELEQKQKLITDYLNDIQTKVLEQKDYLHTIEQKRISGGELSVKEFEIYEKMTEFQSVRLELETCIKNNYELKRKDERNWLYRLLILSKWFSKYFREMSNG